MSARCRSVSRSFLFPSRSIAMTHFLLRLYDWLHVRPLLRWGLMCCALLALLLGVGQAHFKEDIGDFLPDASRYGDETAVYAQANAGDRIAVVFSGAPADSLVAAVDAFTAGVRAALHQSCLPSIMEHLVIESSRSGREAALWGLSTLTPSKISKENRS